MKIVLQKDVPALGKKGEVKEVAAGYAQNYLIKNGLAVLCTPVILRVAEQNQANAKQQLEKQKEENKVLASKIKKTTIITKLKTGKDGSVFSSVNMVDIITLLKKQDIILDKSQITLSRPIKTLGEHKIKVSLLDNLKPEFILKIDKE